VRVGNLEKNNHICILLQDSGFVGTHGLCVRRKTRLKPVLTVRPRQIGVLQQPQTIKTLFNDVTVHTLNHGPAGRGHGVGADDAPQRADYGA
jgi:hypothetical protein